MKECVVTRRMLLVYLNLTTTRQRQATDLEKWPQSENNGPKLQRMIVQE